MYAHYRNFGEYKTIQQKKKKERKIMFSTIVGIKHC